MVKKLRRKGKKYKHQNQNETRGKIVISHTIHERPLEGNLRCELGHWEADTVVGKMGGACLITLTDRKSRYLLAEKVPGQRADPVKDSMIELLKGLPKAKRRTMTPDRGKEFSFHKDVTKKLEGLPFYFADPQSPWQRGTNENTNGLLREYFPKHQSLDKVTPQILKEVLRKINTRPRKCLNWKTPFEVFFNRVLHLI
ncbi:transposase InsI for insertion sequence element IS30A InsI [Enterococcus devriesei]|uniref:Transposase InsI for insertion sequence element IS30A InsI n=1 Tax=Enterococcus devriesei TaxID=319970 RepID=A0A1L8SQ07_9ENTE|nr:transposase InsI for insertion sequence element IS30A InsI [Enterococcus devriesei]